MAEDFRFVACDALYPGDILHTEATRLSFEPGNRLP
jgi:hypothetical protein